MIENKHFKAMALTLIYALSLPVIIASLAFIGQHLQ